MPCCMAEKYSWCRSQSKPIIYKDEEGKEYCLFHAPQGKKGMTVPEFNSKILEEIDRALTYKSRCDFSGTIFDGDIQFLTSNAFPDITFNDAVFNGEAKFDDVVFAGEVLFTNTQFKGNATFWRTIFKGYTNFYSAQFMEGAYFGWANFENLTWFNEATFHKVAAFDNAKINGDLEFVWTVFKGRANFLRATFNEKIRFDGCTFHGQASFIQAEFNDKAFFTKRYFADTGTFVESGLFLNVVITGKVRFEGINCRKLSFLDTDVKQIDFINCEWEQVGGRNVLYDEKNLVNKPDEELTSDFKKVEMLYRKLKQKYKEEHDEQEASNWHYGEKEMFRKSNKWRKYLPSLVTIYWLTSGYGERPVRSLSVLLFFIFAASIISLYAGLSLPPGLKEVYGIGRHDLQAGLTAKTALPSLMNTLKYVTFQRDPFFKPAGWFGEFVKLVAQVVVPIQAALLAFAVRNRFRR